MARRSLCALDYVFLQLLNLRGDTKIVAIKQPNGVIHVIDKVLLPEM
ncbi:hypothetical protein KHC17_06330 [Agrobacterium salinitolerans]|nr:hypothetical protein [Agrobacterium salinitolerans]QXC47961.1 hypothetical protein KHC17_06330 [Agrobacterium salinitolerans]